MWSHLKEKSIIVPDITSEEISKQVEPVLRAMEGRGIKLDVAEFKRLEDKLASQVEELEASIYNLAECGFNIGSPSQMADILFNKLKLPQEELKRTKTGPSTAASELNKIKDKHEIIAPILEYRELSKLLSTYLRPLPLLVDESSRLHTHYAQDVATGRISSNNPNLQNIPVKGTWGADIRRAFVAEPGNVLISADYSQIELRIVACLAEDKEMIESFTSGRDIHTETAADVFNKKPEEVTKDERRFAKTINFGVLYGMSPYGLSQALNIAPDSAAEYIKRYNEVYSGIYAYCQRMISEAEENGYVETLFGMRRNLPNINSHLRYIAEGEQRMAINTPVQGTAAEVLKLAMIELELKLNDETRMMNDEQKSKSQTSNSEQDVIARKHDEAIYHKEIAAPPEESGWLAKTNQAGKSTGLQPAKAQLLLTVHDELVVEVPEDQAKEIATLVKETMENVIKLCVPIEVEVRIGKNWAEAK